MAQVGDVSFRPEEASGVEYGSAKLNNMWCRVCGKCCVRFWDPYSERCYRLCKLIDTHTNKQMWIIQSRAARHALYRHKQYLQCNINLTMDIR